MNNEFLSTNISRRILMLFLINGLALFLFTYNSYDRVNNEAREQASDTLHRSHDLQSQGGDQTVVFDRVLKGTFYPSGYWTSSIHELARSLTADRRRRGSYLPVSVNNDRESDNTNWTRFNRNIRQFSLYDPDDPTVEAVLKDMTSLPIVEINDALKGTQMKMFVKFQNGEWAILKPKRVNFHNTDRHFAEIAAFHLDRLLGYYRVPPTVGRYVNIDTELIPLFSDDYKKTVTRSRSGRTCFYGQCNKLCLPEMPVCGTPHHLEVSLQYVLPHGPSNHGNFTEVSDPWKTTRRKELKPEWVSEEFLCDKTRRKFKSGQSFLLDVIDAVYFDMLIDNEDRHHFATYAAFGSEFQPILLDQGKGFRSECEDGQLHNFLHQRGGCCVIRKSTFLLYLKLSRGPEPLSALMREALEADPVAPVLSEEHLDGLDRRVDKLLDFIANCLIHNRLDDVILDDLESIAL